MSSTANYLREKEWSMGNGQCPECCGVPARWYGHPCHRDPATIGHKLSCALAAALNEIGHKALMQGDFVSAIQYENYISDNGHLATRPKTKDGCPKLKAFYESVEADWYDALIASYKQSPHQSR